MAKKTPDSNVVELPAVVTAPPSTEEAPRKRVTVVPPKYKARYANPEVNKGLPGTNGSKLAFLLNKLLVKDLGFGQTRVDVAMLNAIGAENGIDVQARWGMRNVGQQRMNLGNVLRGMLQRGEKVVIAGVEIGREYLD